jgi:hypothetical protein
VPAICIAAHRFAFRGFVKPGYPASRPIGYMPLLIRVHTCSYVAIPLGRNPPLTCISHRTLRVALWRRLFSLPRRPPSRRMDREPLQQRVSAGVPRRQPKRLRHEQLAQCRLKGDEKSGLTSPAYPGAAPGAWLESPTRSVNLL